MSEASATADLVEMTGRVIEAVIRHDLEAAMSFYAPTQCRTCLTLRSKRSRAPLRLAFFWRTGGGRGGIG
jgi:hypothetical protein